MVLFALILLFISTFTFLINCKNGIENEGAPITAIIKPKEGEKAFTGDSIQVQWTGSDTVVKLYVRYDNGNFTEIDYSPISSKIIAFQAGNWSDSCQLKIQSLSDPSQSVMSQIFSVKPLILTAPIGGESFIMGELLGISWKADTNYLSSITISLSANGGKTWELVHDNSSINIVNTTSYTWEITDKNGALVFPSTECMIKIVDYSNPLIMDKSLVLTINTIARM